MFVTFNETVTVPLGVAVMGLAVAVIRRPFSAPCAVPPKLMAALEPESCWLETGENAVALKVSEAPVPKFAGIRKDNVFSCGAFGVKLFNVQVIWVPDKLQPVEAVFDSNVVP